MDLSIFQARWQLGDIRPDEVHEVATALLVDGLESPTIVQLAGMRHAGFWQVAPVIDRVFRENGLDPISDDEARWRLAYECARQITAGDLEPRTGATRLWTLANELNLPEPLRYFVYLAADYGEGPSGPAWFDARIRETAQELLAQQPSADPTSVRKPPV
jgi:hypothetical protein